MHIPCIYHAYTAVKMDTRARVRAVFYRVDHLRIHLVVQVALRSARGGQDGACDDGGGGASAAAAGAGGAGRPGGEWPQTIEGYEAGDAAGDAGLGSKMAAVTAVEGRDKGGQGRGPGPEQIQTEEERRPGLAVGNIGVRSVFQTGGQWPCQGCYGVCLAFVHASLW